MVAWPGSLQQTLSIGTTEVQQPGFIRTKMDAGPFKQRGRFTAVTRFLTSTMTFDEADRRTFDDFFNDALGYGADAFDFYDPESGTLVSMRFTAPPRYTAIAGGGAGATGAVVGVAAQWRVSMELEILP